MELGKQNFNGNVFYDIEYKDKDKIISMSLETIENYFQVIIFKLVKGKMPDYDDKAKTLHLSNLSNKIFKTLTKQDFKENKIYFQSIEAKNKTERMILKSAMDLRLCLRNYSFKDETEKKLPWKFWK
ncbi:hypothetical protein [Aureitalea marina]|nr:hypothetical protein [Aureitalea marina]